MKNNKSFFILLAILVVILTGAWFLYDNLGSQFHTGGLALQETAAPIVTTTATTVPETAPSTTAATTAPETTSSTTAATTAPDTTADKAPNFTMTDLQGNSVELQDFFDKPILLNFWASWCGPCKSEMPDLEKAYQQYGDDIHFLIVNLTDGSRETVASASGYIQQEGYTFPIYFDTTTEGAIAYRAYSIPVTYFIGEDGVPIAYCNGAMDSKVLQQGIDLLLQ